MAIGGPFSQSFGGPQTFVQFTSPDVDPLKPLEARFTVILEQLREFDTLLSVVPSGTPVNKGLWWHPL